MSLMQQNSCSKGILMELIILLMEQGKLGHPSTQHEGPRCQDHASMNTKVLVDPLVWLRLNDQKANVRTKRKVIEEWKQLQVDVERTPLVPKSILVKLASSHLTNILGIPRWGVGSIPPRVLAKVKKDEDLASLIGGSKLTYAKALKASWDSQSWKKGSNKNNTTFRNQVPHRLSWIKNYSWLIS